MGRKPISGQTKGRKSRKNRAPKIQANELGRDEATESNIRCVRVCQGVFVKVCMYVGVCVGVAVGVGVALGMGVACGNAPVYQCE